jgi:hypothetical protein
MDKPAFKRKLKETALSILGERMEASRLAMLRAKEAMENDEKSSMGDKYETSRAMGHLDNELHARNYENAKKQLEALQKIKVDAILEKAGTGAFVKCNDISYFISTGLGTVEMEGMKLHMISASSPAAIAMNGLKSGDTFTLNGTTRTIEEIF